MKVTPAIRRPFTKIKVLLRPKPRRFIELVVARPWELTPYCWLPVRAVVFIVRRCLRKSSIFAAPEFSIVVLSKMT